jgi:GMP synthase (glutamine-hydrolysing)
MALRFLVVEGNVRAARERHKADFGRTPSDSYAQVLGTIATDAVCDIAFPADEGANLPDPAGLESYDAVVLTGSGLNAYNGGPEVTRQIELARAVYRSGMPAFGSCWGIQIGALAAGGDVQKNPRGREIGFARRITKTDAGIHHPLLGGRPLAFDAPAVHIDAVTTLPDDITVLASNALTPVQAAEIRFAGGTFWGVQYHPEFDLAELAAILNRHGPAMTTEGFFKDRDDQDRYIGELRALHDDRDRLDLAWRFGLDEQVLSDAARTVEIRNFIKYRVLPTKSGRGRA